MLDPTREVRSRTRPPVPSEVRSRSSRWAAPTRPVMLEPRATQTASSTSDDGSLSPRSTSER